MSKDDFAGGVMVDPNKAPGLPPTPRWRMVLKISSIGGDKLTVEKPVFPLPPGIPAAGQYWEVFPYTDQPSREITRVHWTARNVIEVWFEPMEREYLEKLLRLPPVRTDLDWKRVY